MKSILVILLLFSTNSFAQLLKIDSLKKIDIPQNDTGKVNLLNEYSYFYCVISTDSSLKYAEKARVLASKINFKIGLAKSFINIGRVYYYQDNFAKALEWDINGLKVYEELKNKKGIADCLRNIANVYLNQKLFEKAVNNYQKGLLIYEKLKDKKGIGNCLRGLANSYVEDKKFDLARENFTRALQLYEEINDKKNMATCYSNLGDIYAKTNKYQLAFDYQMKGLKIKEEIGDKKGIAIIQNSLGSMKMREKKLPQALNYFLIALETSKEIKSLELMQRNFESLASIYEKMNDFTKAYQYHVLFKHCSDSLFNKENLKNQTQLEMKYEFEKETQKNELEQQKKDLINSEELSRIKTIGIASILGLLLMIFLFILIYKNYRTKKKANELLTIQKKEIEEKNQILNLQNEEIKAQRDELETQSKFLMKQGDKIASQHQKIREQMAIVNQQKKEIMDSIHYAKRIQLAILPPDEFINKHLKDHFILYKPKDIVSGDFYWVEIIETRVLFSAVDCTGHGVPGAFMSIVGNNGLERAVHEQKLLHPGEILDTLDDFVVETLRQTNKTDVKDGMDIVLCSYDFATNTFEFSGANNPLYLLRKKPEQLILNGNVIESNIENEHYSLFEIKGDKQPIGAIENRKKFTNHTFPVLKEDSFYIFSDGYADQFGGEKGKKFKYSKLKDILINLQNFSMLDQKKYLDKTMEDWKGKLEQVDDILLMGIRF